MKRRDSEGRDVTDSKYFNIEKEKENIFSSFSTADLRPPRFRAYLSDAFAFVGLSEVFRSEATRLGLSGSVRTI